MPVRIQYPPASIPHGSHVNSTTAAGGESNLGTIGGKTWLDQVEAFMRNLKRRGALRGILHPYIQDAIPRPVGRISNSFSVGRYIGQPCKTLVGRESNHPR